ncbi:MAG: hypothetical protein Q8N94_03490 [Methanoregula sp.]|nr:hypothetical protein [Methanoregula sp.]
MSILREKCDYKKIEINTATLSGKREQLKNDKGEMDRNLDLYNTAAGKKKINGT